MLLTFLAAADGSRLSKRFVKEGGALRTEPYPHVRRFHSFERDVVTLEEAYEWVAAHAEMGHCLLKGRLDRPLQDESRAGHTNSEDLTEYMVLDLDFDAGFESIDDFLESIGLSGVDYILHHSSSSGIKSKPGLRAHIIMMLGSPTRPAVLKEWLRSLNVSNDRLRQVASLGASGLSIKFGLDPTVCQNDKLIYIADPTVEGLEDPMAGQRFELHKRTNRHAPAIGSRLVPAETQAKIDNLINELRAARGLPKQKPRTRELGTKDLVLLNPDQAVVTGERKERGFTYLNLNGGDSWAYYFPDDNPEYLYNFKDEPIVRLRDIAPDYYDSLIRKHPEHDIVEPGTERFVFRHNRTDTYHTVILNRSENWVDVNKASRSNLKDFLQVAGLRLPNPIPEWELVFDPTTNNVIDFEKQWINTFRPTAFLSAEADPGAAIPPTINRVISSVCVDNETKDHFLNWLAFIFQTRKKSKTAWIFHGVEGTGKGLLITRIIEPLFGKNHCREITVGALKGEFNGWLRRAIFVAVDEVKIEEDGQVAEKLRNYITEDTVAIREMRSEYDLVPNFTNFILATNHADPIRLSASDRRYNVAPRQTNPLAITDEDVANIRAELDEFAQFLGAYGVNAERAARPMNNQAKTEMREAGEMTGERIFRALAEEDLQFFIDLMAPSETITPDFREMAYDKIVTEWYEQVVANGGMAFITTNQIKEVYDHLANTRSGGVTKIFINKQMKQANFIYARSGNTGPRGFSVKFKMPETAPKPQSVPNTSNVRPLRGNAA